MTFHCRICGAVLPVNDRKKGICSSCEVRGEIAAEIEWAPQAKGLLPFNSWSQEKIRLNKKHCTSR